LIPYQVEIGTAITIALVGAILATYLLVLKRNGWIGKATIEKSQTENTLQNKPELKTQKLPPIIIENKVTIAKNENKQPETSENKPLAIKKEEPKNNEKTDFKKVSITKKETPEGCNHYFGYLRSLPKATATPDSCYCCLKLIDCFKEASET
jgi:hypothetical protein